MYLPDLNDFIVLIQILKLNLNKDSSYLRKRLKI